MDAGPFDVDLAAARDLGPVDQRTGARLVSRPAREVRKHADREDEDCALLAGGPIDDHGMGLGTALGDENERLDDPEDHAFARCELGADAEPREHGSIGQGPGRGGAWIAAPGSQHGRGHLDVFWIQNEIARNDPAGQTGCRAYVCVYAAAKAGH